MLKNFRNKFSHYKDGLKSLLFVHKIDKIAIPLNVLQSIISGVTPYIELILWTMVIDTIVLKDIDKIVKLLIIMVVAKFIFGIIIDFLDKINNYKSKNIQQKMIVLISSKAMEIDYSVLENPQTLQQITDAEYTMEHTGGIVAFISYYRELAKNIFTILISFALILELCLSSASSSIFAINILASKTVSIAAIIIITVLNFRFNNYVAKKSKRHSSELFNENRRVERQLNYYTNNVYLKYPFGKDIRIFAMKDMINTSYSKYIEDAKSFFGKHYYTSNKNKESWNILSSSIYTLITYILVVIKALAKSITIGGMVKYVNAISMFNASIVKIIDLNQLIKLQTEYIRVFNDFLDVENVQKSGKLDIRRSEEKKYVIEFHDVSFKYPHNDEYVLRNVSCRIDFGKKLAIVGKNGAGKTTFIKLLIRLYEATEGFISLNGVDIRDYNYEEYKMLFSIVFQDFKLLALSIKENVAIGKYADEDKILEALKLSGVEERIKSLPENIDTNIYKYDANGVEFSGGELQKIAIARAIYKDSPFVILDEPTSALDPISEYETYSKFKEITENKTSIYISHRMGSCRFCEDILVLDKGFIIQRGNHEELLEDSNNVYAELYTKQAENYKI